MDQSFIESLNKKINLHRKAQKKHQQIKRLRSIFLMLNREKYKQFSFQQKVQKFWTCVSFKTVEFECEVNSVICETEKALQEAQHERNVDKISSIEKKVKYYNLVLKTLKKHDKQYGKKMCLALNRLFCKDISCYIREFI
jgi:hypothetical protein